MIPFLDLKKQTDEIRAELDAAYHRFMDSGVYVLGQEVELFEKEYAAYCEADYCVGVANGLDALHLALRALDVGPGDEVIVPSNTYIATWLAVTQVGATIIPVEPDIRTYNICPDRIATAITERTKVILPVNLYGQPVDYDPILEIAQKAGAYVVIDNAQAHGARYKGRRVGGIADIECHSFYPSKNLGAYGEAGAITTKIEPIASRIRLLRNYGSRVRYYNEECGYNSRIDALQASFLRVKLKYLDKWNEHRSKIAAYYLEKLSNFQEALTLPTVPGWAECVWHLFVIRCVMRNELMKSLNERGVGTLVHYPVAIHRSNAYTGFSAFSLPIALELADTVLSLPVGPMLAISEAQEVVRNIGSSLADISN
jgi:dTDP-4-amino-4,6-dideoxygalactose transaminase